MTQGRPAHLTFVDLFSGSGGMSSGFLQTRGRFLPIGAVDLEVAKPGRGRSSGTTTACNPTYARNIGIEPKNADLLKLDPKVYRRELGLAKGELSLLISCAPCTGFSQKNANNHAADDPRNRLVQRTGDFVAELLPEFLVMENVKELLNGNQGHHFRALRARLTRELGYRVWAGVHDLTGFGLPQRRIRALVIARRGKPIVGPVPSVREPRTVRQTIAHLAPLEAGGVDGADPMHITPRISQPVLDRLRAIPHDGGSWGDVMNNPRLSRSTKERLLIPSMFRARPGSFPDVYGRMWWDRPAPTITRECAHVGNGRYVHPEQDRLLTVREMALLQGFPPKYRFEGPLNAKYNQVGDAVPPLVAKAIAKHLLAIHDGKFDVERAMALREPQFDLLAG